jgi:hypothetical protein
MKPISVLPDKSAITAAKYEELRAHLVQAESSRWKDIAVAFSVGAVACLVILLGVKARSLTSSAPVSYAPMPSRETDTDMEVERYSFQGMRRTETPPRGTRL